MSEQGQDETSAVSKTEVALDRDVFLRNLIRDLAGTLESVVGLEEAEGFVSVVGQRIGEWINREYMVALGRDALDRGAVAEVLVDLKRRIQGDFYVIEQDDSKIVLGNRACPFGDRVVGRPSMCMMTSNVFGVITAEHLGYSRIELKETIAEGDRGCLVVVHLQPAAGEEEGPGREYFRT